MFLKISTYNTFSQVAWGKVFFHGMKSGQWAIFDVGDKWNQKLRDFIDKKVVVGGEAIGMIYVAIKKVICSLDLAASSLHGGNPK